MVVEVVMEEECECECECEWRWGWGEEEEEGGEGEEEEEMEEEEEGEEGEGWRRGGWFIIVGDEEVQEILNGGEGEGLFEPPSGATEFSVTTMGLSCESELGVCGFTTGSCVLKGDKFC